MAIRIELWSDGQLVGGAEQWWDDIEASLPDESGEAGFPMLSRVDPYGDAVFDAADMNDLASEVRRFSAQAPESVRLFLEKLASLCDEAAQGEQSELRFLGD